MQELELQFDEDMMLKDLKRTKERQNQQENRGGRKTSVDFFKVEENKNNIFRILAAPKNDFNRFTAYLEIMKHFVTNGEKTVVVNCTMEQYGDCPFCVLAQKIKTEAYAEIDKNLKDHLFKKSSQFKAQTSFVYTVMNEEGTIGFLDVPLKLHNAISGQYENQKLLMGADFINPYSPTKGSAFLIKKEKKVKTADFYEWIYTVSIHPKSSPLPQNILDNYTTEYKFPEQIQPKYTVADLTKALAGDFSFMKKKEDNSDVEFDTSKMESTSTQVPTNNATKLSQSTAPKVAELVKPKAASDDSFESVEDILNS